MRPVDEPLDPVKALVALDEPTLRRARLNGVAADLLAGLEWDVRVLSGRVGEQLLAFALQERPNVLIAGTTPLQGPARVAAPRVRHRSEEHTSELQSRQYLVCRLLL